MKKTLRSTGIVGLATAGSGALLLLLAAITGMLTVLDREPADYLPAAGTVALLQHPTAQTLLRLEPWFPELRGVEAAGIHAIAVVATPEGGREPIVFRKPRAGAENAGTMLGGFGVSASPGALRALAGKAPTLGQDPAYLALDAGKKRSDSWVFLRRSAVPLSASFGDKLLQGLLLANAEAFALTEPHEGRFTLERYSGSAVREVRAAPPRAPEGGALSLSAAAPADSWETLLQQLSEQEKTALLGSALQLLREGFGEAVSFEYDILPLFAEELRLTLHRTESGALLAVVRGRAAPERIATSMGRLHEGVRSRLPTVQVEEYSFDNRFVTRNIREDRSEIAEELTMHQGWQLRGTAMEGSSFGLFSAVRKEEFILGNTRAIVTAALETEGAAANQPAGQSTLLMQRPGGSGRVETALLSQVLQKAFPPLAMEQPSVLLPLLPATALRWSVERRGPVETVALERE